MTFQLWKSGMKATTARLNDGDMIGAVVFMAQRTTAQAIPTGTEAAANAVVWDQIDRDILTGWSSGSATRWTCPTTGIWVLAGSVGFNSSTGGTTRDACWFVNGALLTAGRARTFASGSISAVALTIEARTLPLLLTAGDYVQLVPAHNVGSNLDTASGSLRPYMSVTYGGAQ